MSHVPTVLKSDRSVFDKMLPVDDNEFTSGPLLGQIHIRPARYNETFLMLNSTEHEISTAHKN